MSSYYITGIAGSGKTTIRDELILRGYTAQDTDDYGHWVDMDDQSLVERPANLCDPKWHERHKWLLPTETIQGILAQYACKDTIFMCGTSSNDHEITALFDGVICITIDPDVLVRRLLSRPNSDFGKSPEELGVVSEWHLTLEEYHRKNGAKMIDGQQPTSSIVDEILHTVTTKPRD